MDFVSEIGAFAYMIDKLAVFREIYRVLRPSGAFAYQDWTNTGYNLDDPKQFEKVLKVKMISGLIELHDPKELAAVAKEAGFEVIFNADGGYQAKAMSQLLVNMQQSFWFIDWIVKPILKVMPSRLTKGLGKVRPDDGFVLKETIDHG